MTSHTVHRRALTKDDVAIKIHYAGICHSDIHQAKEEWGPAIFPMVPGHEIGGVVEAVGENVTVFAVGDIVGVGCMVGSCGACSFCKEVKGQSPPPRTLHLSHFSPYAPRHPAVAQGFEQYCQMGMVGTYNGKEKFPHMAEYTPEGGNPTYGGYAESIVVNKDFVLKVT